MIDLHCHIVPNVDDGASDLNESIEMIRAQVRQGVTEICLTPHMRIDMFCTSDDKIAQEYRQLVHRLKEEHIQVKLRVSREYFYDTEFRKRLRDGKVMPMGDFRVLLLEFGLEVPSEILPEASKRVQEAGFTPMFAHVERYRAVQKDIELVKQLMDMGTVIQINAGALLGDDGKQLKNVAWSLLRKGYVSVIASDAHGIRDRVPNLRRCYTLLEKEIGRKNAEILLCRNPEAILRNTEESSDAESGTHRP